MARWRKKLLHAGRKADDIIDNITAKLKRRLQLMKPAHIISYRTYGTPRKIYIRGRVIADKNIIKAGHDDTLWVNLLNMYKRFETDEIPGAVVEINVGDEKHEVVTDKEGYFIFNITPKEPVLTPALYYEVHLKLVAAPVSVSRKIVKAEIMIPPADAEYGIISDIDDTVIKTGATNLLAMGKTVLLGNALTRLPFPGVSEFYKALQLGRNGKRNNPFFYISSSPWNLYDLLVDFMDHNKIPHGPLLLRDFGLQSDSFMSGDHLSHKYGAIKNVLNTYPDLPFILIGDSGEQDTEIYLEVIKNFPGRIMAVYIREINTAGKQNQTQEFARLFKDHNVPLIITADTTDAARHAAQSGFIYQNKVDIIEQDASKDEGKVPGKAPQEIV